MIKSELEYFFFLWKLIFFLIRGPVGLRDNRFYGREWKFKCLNDNLIANSRSMEFFLRLVRGFLWKLIRFDSSAHWDNKLCSRFVKI